MEAAGVLALLLIPFIAVIVHAFSGPRKPFVCGICGLRLTNRHTVYRDVSVEVPGKQPVTFDYVCSKCNNTLYAGPRSKRRQEIMERIAALAAPPSAPEPDPAPSPQAPEPEITFTCRHCSNPVTTSASHAGKKGRCPHCQQTMPIPIEVPQ